MRVMITGGTGFIGYHCTQAMLEAGHEVTLLIRSEDKMRGLYGDRIHHHVVGDIAEQASVDEALAGCDAVIHTAAMVSMDIREAEKVYHTNLQGTKLVIGGAAEQGIQTIIYLSSATALFDPTAEHLDENSPVGVAENAYGRSKVDSEKFVRQLIDQGAPVYSIYPTAVIGPQSPTITEPHEGIILQLNRIVPVPPSGMQFVDVRDIAQVLRHLLEEKHPPGRYAVRGHWIDWSELIERVQRLTGRASFTFPLPGSLMRLMGRLIDWLLHRVAHFDIPISHEGSVYATQWVAIGEGNVERELGFIYRDPDESLADTIRWLHEAGHVSRAKIGRLAAEPDSERETTPSCDTL